jgi:hypothetical protein
MNRQAIMVIYVAAMVAAIAAMDIMFFRKRLWVRLAVNIAIVLAFAAFYLEFLRHA